jgi:hypothetical protein
VNCDRLALWQILLEGFVKLQNVGRIDTLTGQQPDRQTLAHQTQRGYVLDDLGGGLFVKLPRHLPQQPLISFGAAIHRQGIPPALPVTMALTCAVYQPAAA